MPACSRPDRSARAIRSRSWPRWPDRMLAAERIELLLASSPDRPKAARFLSRLRGEYPPDFDRIANSPPANRAALAIFSYSCFLAEAVLRDPERIVRVANSRRFYRALSTEEYQELLAASTDSLAGFRRRQLLRIALRDVLGAATLAEVTQELSNLSDAILDAACRRVRTDVAARHGEPRLEDGGICRFSIVSLGKLGGSELNYSSDIDLMFIYEGNGQTDGPAPISNKEFYKKVANECTA